MWFSHILTSAIVTFGHTLSQDAHQPPTLHKGAPHEQQTQQKR